MTVRLELDPDVAARIGAQAAARGLSVEAYLQSLIEIAARTGPPGSATIALLDAWAAEDETNDPAELERRHRDSEEF